MVLENFIVDAPIIWDRVGKKIFENPHVKQGRKMRVQITNAGMVEDLSEYTLALGWKHTVSGVDGLDVFEDGSEANVGIFEMAYTENLMTNLGNLKASLVLTSVEDMVVAESNDFYVKVDDSPFGADAEQGVGSYTRLAQILLNEESRIASEVARVSAEETRVTDFNALVDSEIIAQNVATKLTEKEATFAPRMLSLESELAETKGLREITYITPYDFGAIGNNIADDTEALRLALWASHTLGVVLFFPSNCKCRVTQPLNYINNAFQDLKLNIVGSTPSGTWLYALGEYGGIRLDAKASLFKSGRISGSIKNMTIVGKRDVDYHFFESCTLSGTCILENTISNFSSFTYDSSINGVSRIDLNTFLTIFNFFKHKLIGRTITDSFITGNYINGGQEPTDNVCFAFADGNGSVVQGNFIDYYHTIYKPPIAQTIQLPTSIGNQYQVFLYFYDLLNFVTTVTFLSSGDTFNWTDKSSLAHLNNYEEKTITSEDGVARIVPTYIFNPKQASTIVIENAKIESNVGNVVYIHLTTSQYGIGDSRASFVGVDRYSQNRITYLDGEKPYYNAGQYLQRIIEPFFIVDVEQLPTLSLGWSKYPAGTRVRYNYQNYRLINKYSPTLSKFVPTWIETDDI